MIHMWAFVNVVLKVIDPLKLYKYLKYFISEPGFVSKQNSDALRALNYVVVIQSRTGLIWQS